MYEQIDVSESPIVERYLDQKTELEAVFRQIDVLPKEDQVIALRAMKRYLVEAINNSYQTDPAALTQFIADNKLLEGSEALLDLGAGPGDLLQQLALVYPDMRMDGMDLSPGFVANFNQRNRLPNARMAVGLIDSPLRYRPSLDGGNNASAISVLTLDRLARPRTLIENMAQFTRARILATLLPIIPEDDNPSRQGEDVKIVYTRPPNRIVPGRTALEDRDVLLRLLKEAWQRPVEVEDVKYTVSSSGDTQNYNLGVFYAHG